MDKELRVLIYVEVLEITDFTEKTWEDRSSVMKIDPKSNPTEVVQAVVDAARSASDTFSPTED